MIIVADASPLIGLSQIGQLNLLNRLFKEIVLPPAIVEECTLHSHKPGAKIIQTAIDESKLKIFNNTITPIKNLSAVLGPGEIEAISLAKQLTVPLLIDERLGRIAAKHHDAAVIGTCGILLSAKQLKIIKAVKPIMHQLLDTGYRISTDLQLAILKAAKEK